MKVIDVILDGVVNGVKSLYGFETEPGQVTWNLTRKDFEGDYTIVVFPYTKVARKKPEDIGRELGDFLLGEIPAVARFNVVNGFLNLVISDRFWVDFIQEAYADDHFGRQPSNGKKVLVEFCSPNTNKPLHLGHIRNILLGWSSYKILQAAGYEVVRIQIINDRGIAICKSMLAWQKYAGGATPGSTGKKGDHFVGEYYVLFEKQFQEEYKAWQQSEKGIGILADKKKPEQTGEEFFKAYKNQYFNEFSALGAQAKDMLRRWEAGDPDTIALWKQMNGWVYEGFEQTYAALGVAFDKLYYESETYLLGKDMVQKGLDANVFYRKEDGSVWADLEDAGLDKKAILRSDGTSLYVTQDLGTAHQRYLDHGADKMIYVVADEQNYHFQVLFELIKRLGEPYAGGLFHLSYGMVDLTTGKMKSREGTVVDADDLIAEVIADARDSSQERERTANLTAEEQEEIIRNIGLSALKFYITKVHPKKRMTFDPKESVDLQGQTGPYIQNAFVRIRSVIRNAPAFPADACREYADLNPEEKDLVNAVYSFPGLILEAAENYDPSTIANFCYSLAKSFHKFYHDHSILNADTEAAKSFRLVLSTVVSKVLKTGMDLLGIDMPEYM
ncbi:MAG: arginine--tRNA ligase [Lewinellaceae bacterium]|nr:arginine--tRNA ligase [Lewinellaceae bacterium]